MDLVNPYRGEIMLSVNGTRYPMRLSLRALAWLEAHFGATHFADLIKRFDHGTMKAADISAVLYAGLKAAGIWQGAFSDLEEATLDEGLTHAARQAARLFWRSFAFEEQNNV